MNTHVNTNLDIKYYKPEHGKADNVTYLLSITVGGGGQRCLGIKQFLIAKSRK